MPFISTYKGAMGLLKKVETGSCTDTCRSTWIRNFKYALKTKANPLKLTSSQRKTLTSKLQSLKGKRITRKRKLEGK